MFDLPLSCYLALIFLWSLNDKKDNLNARLSICCSWKVWGEGELKRCMHSLSFPFNGKTLDVSYIEWKQEKKNCKIKENSCKGIAENLLVERSAVLNILCMDIIFLRTQHNSSLHWWHYLMDELYISICCFLNDLCKHNIGVYR